MRPVFRRSIAAACLLAAAGLAALVLSGREPQPLVVAGPPAPAPLPEERGPSLLAVGDTGETLPWRPFGESQRSVARGLAAEDAREPVDALVLLGDNFYPSGLRQQELLERVRRNLVAPYCRFVSAGAPRWEEVADACGVPVSGRHPVPLLAVLGNHDHKSPESPGLQQRVVPELVANWSVNEGLADVVELGRGVSLVRVDSELLKGEADDAPLRTALARARGPWRIVAVHEPIGLREGRGLQPDSFEARLRRALSEARRPPQLVLTGHEHNLQLVQLDLAAPALQVIAGGGSSRKPLKQPQQKGLRFAHATTGFARIDVRGSGDAQGLLVSLFAAPRYPIHFWRRSRMVSQWWVARDGTSGQVYPVPES